MSKHDRAKGKLHQDAESDDSDVRLWVARDHPEADAKHYYEQGRKLHVSRMVGEGGAKPVIYRSVEEPEDYSQNYVVCRCDAEYGFDGLTRQLNPRCVPHAVPRSILRYL